MTTNIHIYPTTFKFESRILKIAQSITETELFDKILILATWSEGLRTDECIQENPRKQVRRLKLLFGNSKYKLLPIEILKYLEYLFRTLLVAKQEQVTCVNAHSLSVLPIAVVVKLLYGAKLIYDTHELETERNGLYGLRQSFSRVVEAILIRFCDEVVVVSDSIRDWYRQRYQMDQVYSVRNIPDILDRCENKDHFRVRFGLGKDSLLFLYQGIFAKGRGVGNLIEVFAKLSGSEKHLILMGFGPLESEVKAAAQRYPNIHFFPGVPPEEIHEYTVAADVGIVPFENTCLSHYFALPNKFFEYLLCGLPVICSDFPDMSKIVSELDCGWTSAPEAEALSRVISALNARAVVEKQAGVNKAARIYSWQNESETVKSLYKLLFSKESGLKAA